MSVSTFYYHSTAASRRRAEDDAILHKIEEAIELLPDSGYRPITALLKVNHKRIQRIMAENGLQSRKKRKNRKTTDSAGPGPKFPNILKDAEITRINQALVGDVTAYDIRGKDHFLATLMDLKSNRIVGAATSERNDCDLVLSALKMAKETRGDLQGCIHHTDSGTPYRSEKYQALLAEYGMKVSMCVRSVFENAHAESLNKTIKRQEINVSEYRDHYESAESIGRYIYLYNNIRPHSSLQYLSPVECEHKYFPFQF